MDLKIRRLTEGAMYLAIVGAMMLINRIFSSAFDFFIPIAIAVVVILYTTKFALKDGLILGVGIFVITFIYGDILILIYNIVAVFTGIIYGYFAKIGTDMRLLIGASTIPFIIGEFIIMIFIMPILGLDYLEEIYEITEQVYRQYNVAVTLSLLRFTAALFIIITGALEGVLIHLLSNICFKRLKIKVVKTLSLDAMKLKPMYAYLLLIFVGLAYVIERFNLGDDLTYGIYCLGIVAAIILMSQGYIFVLIYRAITHKQSFNFMLIFILILFYSTLFIALLLFGLMIIGFLYASGPLDRYLEKKRRANA